MENQDRVLSIELFFDLVFVFAITQLTSLLVAQPTIAGVAKVGLIFGNVWWMYGGYAWLTNAVPPRDTPLRLLMLLAMAGFMLIALAIPLAFDRSGVAFGVGYLVVTAMHTGLFLRSSHEGTARAMLRLGPYNAVTAVLLLAAGFTGGAGRWWLWIAAFVLHWSSPAVTAVGSFRISAAHFVERHGTIVLIALGESVVAVGIGVQQGRLTAGLIVTALLGLMVAAGLWWMYFDGEDARAQRALDDASAARSPWLALFAFGYIFLLVLGGIVVFAAGVKQAVIGYGSHASAPTAWFLAGGPAVYVGALALFRLVLRTGPVAARLGMSALCLITVAVGRLLSPEVQLGALAVILITGLMADTYSTRKGGWVA